MTLVYAIVNQKGGVGKTTTAVNLSAALVRKGRRVLLVDADPQGNATSGLGVEKRSLERCLYDCLVHNTPVTEVLRQTSAAGLDLIPATLKLADAEIEMVSLLSRETRLRRSLQPLTGVYEYILVDCPPSVGLLTVNTLAAADAAIIPMQCEYYALEGIGSLMSIVEQVRQQINPVLRIGGVLLTMYDSRMRLTEQVVREVRHYFGDRVFKTVIPRNVRLSEAPSHGQSALDYDPGSRGAQAYLRLAEEVIARGTKGAGPGAEQSHQLEPAG